MSPEIASALRLLYGDQITARPDMLRTLDPEALKAAFRKRAMELHPDRAKIIGKSSDELSELFKDVQTAYEQLRELLGPSFDASRHFKKPDKPHMGRTHEPGTHYWEADIPDTRLLFGQFVYYAGLIPWNTLISAITWQRLQRPSFGKIAKMWDYLTDDEIKEIIASRAMGEKLGESALRQGYLTHYQRSAVIGFQKWLQRPIGEFFQEIGILEEEEIRYLLKLARKHNSRVLWSRW